MPSLSSLVAFLDILLIAFSRLSSIGKSSTSNFSTPYLCAFSTSDKVLFKALSRSAFDLRSCPSNSSFLSKSSSYEGVPSSSDSEESSIFKSSASPFDEFSIGSLPTSVSYTHLRAHET